MRPITKDHWSRLSPLLDEILDSDGAARERRLAELRAEDPALADEVAEMMERLAEMDREAFLERPALLRETDSLAEASLVGQSVGAYTIERELGQGGMGSVWLARRTDGRFQGQVAIKFPNAGLVASGGAERFAREGSILARLAHPNIARLLDAGVRDGRPYLVLEYIDGQPIDRYCEIHALDLAQRVRLFLDVLAAVAHAHNRLILHRDLKPSNILVTGNGEVKLLDFGIAKLLDDAAGGTPATEITQAAGRAFTVQYAAPEQVQGGDVTTATDVYALGVLLYVLLGGVHPTLGSRTTAPLDQMRAVVETEPKRVSEAALRGTGLESDAARLKRARALRGDLDNIVARALKKSPAERYANAAALADDLRRYLNDEPVAARPDAVPYVLAKFVRRHRVGVAMGMALAVALGAGIGAALWEAREAKRQQVQAEGLIEFMLGDLRKKLQPVGRLDALDGVGTQALAYYDAQDASRLDADSLGRRARALHLIGEIAERRGSLDEALRVFQRAADSTAELMARYPGDAQRIFDHAQSVFWVGFIARQRGQLADAEASFVRYQALAQQLVRLDPKKPDWRVEVAYAAGNLGVVYLESGRAEQALATFSQMRDTWATLVDDTRFEHRLDLANTWGWIAKAYEALGRFDDAVAAQKTKAELTASLPDVDKNRPAQQLLANAKYELGKLQLMLGRYDPAMQFAAEAVAQFEVLARVDAAGNDLLAHLAFARDSLVEAEIASGRVGVARAELARAMDDVQRLLAADGTRNKWNIALSGNLLLNQLALTESPAALRPKLESFISAADQAAVAGKPLDNEQIRIVSAVEVALGDLLARDAQSEAARRQWQSAAERLQPLVARAQLPAMTLLAQARLRLGSITEARALAARLEASPYRHPAYADLRQRLAAAGGTVPAHP
ncbi:MAG TPA: serine/threonine-protein kinase [Burkholderiaceae bacterium]